MSRRTALVVAGASVGAAAWSLTEYSTHRWLLHGPFGSGRLRRVPLGSVHRNHHRDPEHSVTWARIGANTAMLSVGAVAAQALMSVPAMPTAFAAALGATWGAGYSWYDVSHHALHHRPPRSDMGVRLRQRHFRHHFGAPKRNLGVTTGFWDRRFGTEVEPGPVRVPARFAPEWLDQLGPEFTRADA